MEYESFKVHICLKMGILLFFLALTASREHSSSDFTEKYISEAYFEKHDSLLDLDFEDFIARELPLGSCEVLQEKFNIVPKLSVMGRHLIGEGSHRRLSSSIGFKIQPESLSELTLHFCEVIIVERLPYGVFADPFELQHLIQHGVFSDASAFGDTNLELPSVQSNRSFVEVHMDVGPNMLSGNKNGLEINIELPLHARYPPLGEQGYSRVEFGSPDLFTRCIVQGNLHNQSCLFVSSDNSAKSNSGAVLWEVPCGIKEQARVVSVVTFVSAIVSAFLIVLACMCKSDTAGSNGSKQS